MIDGMADVRRLRRINQGADRFLGPLESAVMDQMWDRGEATVREIVDDVGKRRDLAYTTVMTIMSRLHEKGLLARERDGKGYVYRPAFSRELVRGLVDEFGDVALSQFAAELDTVDASHRSALKKLAAKGTRDAR